MTLYGRLLFGFTRLPLLGPIDIEPSNAEGSQPSSRPTGVADDAKPEWRDLSISLASLVPVEMRSLDHDQSDVNRSRIQSCRGFPLNHLNTFLIGGRNLEVCNGVAVFFTNFRDGGLRRERCTREHLGCKPDAVVG